MKVLVLSDSHGSLGNMCEAVEKQNPDAVIHLGDFFRDAEDLASAYETPEYYRVSGNCDYGFGMKKSLTVTLGGVRMFLTHGHLYDVKHELESLHRQAQLAGAQIALFGHTHRPLVEFRSGIWLMNPGTCGPFSNTSYGLITIQNGSFSCEILPCDVE